MFNLLGGKAVQICGNRRVRRSLAVGTEYSCNKTASKRSNTSDIATDR